MGPLRRLAPFDGACIVATDPGVKAGGTGFTFHNMPTTANTPKVIAGELSGRDFNHFDALGRSLWPVGILSEATGGELARSERYHALLVPQAATDELRAACVADSSRWGSITMVRRGGRFAEQDAAAVAQIAGTIAEGLRRTLRPAPGPPTPIDGRAGVLLIDGTDQIESATPAGQQWLAAISDTEALPGIVQQALVRARREPGSTPRLRARIRTGEWIVVHGAELQSSAGDGGAIAVVIELARPLEIASVLLDAYGLTPGERLVTQHVIEGRSTKQIAAALNLSPYTVQDHLKSAFQKVGVRSRGQLVARVGLGS
jgi:DNA-binding CsgD family transcriptional regulator